MRILVIEDDEFKAADILRAIEELSGAIETERAASVTSALRKITTEDYDLLVLDMSLPTFDLSGPGGGGSPQGQGGVEVLRLAKWLGKGAPVVVVTQYPDIEIDGREAPLSSAAARLSERFEIDVKLCILYEFDSDTWRSKFVDVVSAVGAVRQQL